MNLKDLNLKEAKKLKQQLDDRITILTEEIPTLRGEYKKIILEIFDLMERMDELRDIKHEAAKVKYRVAEAELMIKQERAIKIDGII